PSKVPRCIVIAGPNGAGKTTFAREFLPKEADMIHFVKRRPYRQRAVAIAPRARCVVGRTAVPGGTGSPRSRPRGFRIRDDVERADLSSPSQTLESGGLPR